jgi:hypothetical protein
VGFFVFVLDIDNIDGANQSFAVNVFIAMEWLDERLAHEGGKHAINLEAIWNPRIIIANRSGLLFKSMPEIVYVEPNGLCTYRQRYNGALSQPLELYEFPFDQHRFTIQFVSPGYTPDDIRYVPAKAKIDLPRKGGGIYKELSLPDWKIVEYEVTSNPFVPAEGSQVAGFSLEFIAKRYIDYYVWQVIIPLILIVIMSWGALWIDPTSSGTQIGLATTSILTLIAYRFMLGNLIPRLPYMTRLDYFTFGSTVLVFLMLIEVLTTSYLARMSKEKVARKIDRACRVILPVFFIGWACWSFII